MKIVYDHSVFQFQKYGGISRYYYEIMKILSENNGLDINLFQGFHINEYKLSEHRNNFESYWGYKWNYKIPNTKYMSHIFAFPNRIAFNHIYMHSKKYDVYHPTYYSSQMKKFNNTATVVTVHDMIHEIFPNQLRDSKLIIKAKRKSIDIADAIIAVSENTKNDLMNIYGIPEQKIKVVYHGSSLPKSTNYLNMHGLKKEFAINKPFILYVGERQGYKNFSLLMKTYFLYLMDDFNLVCFGGGKFNQDELKLIKNNNAFGGVFHLSGSDYLLGSLYKNAFCFVCPSLYEGFGIPLLEAMGLGCPTIASNTSSIPEVVEDAALLFDPESEESLFNRINTLISNDSKRQKMVSLGFEQEKKFSWNRTANQTYKVYEYASKLMH